MLISFIICISCFITPVKADATTGQKDITTVSQVDLPEGSNLPKGPIYSYLPKDSGQEVTIHVQQDGILYLNLIADRDIHEGILLDSNRKNVPLQKTEDNSFYLKDVKKGAIYYVKLPEIQESFLIEAYVYPDNVQNIVDNKNYVQSGQGKYTYKYFTVSQRSSYTVVTNPVFSDYKNHEYFYLQRKEKNGWKSVSSRQLAEADEHGRMYFAFGFKKGEYRIGIKAATNQLMRIKITGTKNISKYQTKQSKAQKVKLKKTVTNLYTATEKASRWYRMSRTTSKYKRYVKMSVNNNSGKVKFTIYKKGRKKSLKSYTLSGNASKTYRLKNGSGTYYVKVSKSGSKMNGEYKLQYK